LTAYAVYATGKLCVSARRGCVWSILRIVTCARWRKATLRPMLAGKTLASIVAVDVESMAPSGRLPRVAVVIAAAALLLTLSLVLALAFAG
jgi:hypothetical protein